MNSQEVMKKNGRTFFWATRFLPKDEPEDISILYAFCRFVDDLVDLQGKSCQEVLFDLERGTSDKIQVTQLLEMAKRRKMSLEPLHILVNTLEMDKTGTRMSTWSELIRYCYGVASTVGLMMCDIFRMKQKEAYPFAIDLGIGMQLTNIARDIYEDAQNDKIYLPQEAFIGGITIAEIIQDKRERDLINIREEILKMADRYYQSADQGMHFLPRQARLTILIASRLYQAKGFTLRKNPNYYLKRRADVHVFHKIYHTLRALTAFGLIHLHSKAHLHDASLHRDLKFLPATNPPC